MKNHSVEITPEFLKAIERRLDYLSDKYAEYMNRNALEEGFFEGASGGIQWMLWMMGLSVEQTDDGFVVTVD